MVAFLTGGQVVQQRAILQLQGELGVGKWGVDVLVQRIILAPLRQAEAGEQGLAQAGAAEGIVQHILGIDRVDVVTLRVGYRASRAVFVHGAGHGGIAIVAIPEGILEVRVDLRTGVRADALLHQHEDVILVDIGNDVGEELAGLALFAHVEGAGGVALHFYPSLCASVLRGEGDRSVVIADDLVVQRVGHVVQLVKVQQIAFVVRGVVVHIVELAHRKGGGPISHLIAVLGKMELHPVVPVLQGAQVVGDLKVRFRDGRVVVFAQVVSVNGLRRVAASGQILPAALIREHAGNGGADLDHGIAALLELAERGDTGAAGRGGIRQALGHNELPIPVVILLVQGDLRAFHRGFGGVARALLPGVVIELLDGHADILLVHDAKFMSVGLVSFGQIVLGGGDDLAVSHRQHRGLAVIDLVVSIRLVTGERLSDRVDDLLAIAAIDGQMLAVGIDIEHGIAVVAGVNGVRDGRGSVGRGDGDGEDVANGISGGEDAVHILRNLQIAPVRDVLEGEGELILAIGERRVNHRHLDQHDLLAVDGGGLKRDLVVASVRGHVQILEAGVGGVEVLARVGLREVVGTRRQLHAGVAGEGGAQLRVGAGGLVLRVDIEGLVQRGARDAVGLLHLHGRVRLVLNRALDLLGRVQQGRLDIRQIDFGVYVGSAGFDDRIERISGRQVGQNLLKGILLAHGQHDGAAVPENAPVGSPGNRSAGSISRHYSAIRILDIEEAAVNKPAGVGVLLIDDNRHGVIVVVEERAIRGRAARKVDLDILLPADGHKARARSGSRGCAVQEVAVDRLFLDHIVVLFACLLVKGQIAILRGGVIAPDLADRIIEISRVVGGDAVSGGIHLFKRRRRRAVARIAIQGNRSRLVQVGSTGFTIGADAPEALTHRHRHGTPVRHVDVGRARSGVAVRIRQGFFFRIDLVVVALAADQLHALGRIRVDIVVAAGHRLHDTIGVDLVRSRIKDGHVRGKAVLGVRAKRGSRGGNGIIIDVRGDVHPVGALRLALQHKAAAHVRRSGAAGGNDLRCRGLGDADILAQPDRGLVALVLGAEADVGVGRAVFVHDDGPGPARRVIGHARRIGRLLLGSRSHVGIALRRFRLFQSIRTGGQVRKFDHAVVLDGGRRRLLGPRKVRPIPGQLERGSDNDNTGVVRLRNRDLLDVFLVDNIQGVGSRVRLDVLGYVRRESALALHEVHVGFLLCGQVLGHGDARAHRQVVHLIGAQAAEGGRLRRRHRLIPRSDFGIQHERLGAGQRIGDIAILTRILRLLANGGNEVLLDLHMAGLDDGQVLLVGRLCVIFLRNFDVLQVRSHINGIIRVDSVLRVVGEVGNHRRIELIDTGNLVVGPGLHFLIGGTVVVGVHLRNGSIRRELIVQDNRLIVVEVARSTGAGAGLLRDRRALQRHAHGGIQRAGRAVVIRQLNERHLVTTIVLVVGRIGGNLSVHHQADQHRPLERGRHMIRVGKVQGDIVHLGLLHTPHVGRGRRERRGAFSRLRIGFYILIAVLVVRGYGLVQDMEFRGIPSIQLIVLNGLVRAVVTDIQGESFGKIGAVLGIAVGIGVGIGMLNVYIGIGGIFVFVLKQLEAVLIIDNQKSGRHMELQNVVLVEIIKLPQPIIIVRSALETLSSTVMNGDLIMAQAARLCGLVSSVQFNFEGRDLVLGRVCLKKGRRILLGALELALIRPRAAVIARAQQAEQAVGVGGYVAGKGISGHGRVHAAATHACVRIHNVHAAAVVHVVHFDIAAAIGLDGHLAEGDGHGLLGLDLHLGSIGHAEADVIGRHIVAQVHALRHQLLHGGFGVGLGVAVLGQHLHGRRVDVGRHGPHLDALGESALGNLGGDDGAVGHGLGQGDGGLAGISLRLFGGQAQHGVHVAVTDDLAVGQGIGIFTDGIAVDTLDGGHAAAGHGGHDAHLVGVLIVAVDLQEDQVAHVGSIVVLVIHIAAAQRALELFGGLGAGIEFEAGVLQHEGDELGAVLAVGLADPLAVAGVGLALAVLLDDEVAGVLAIAQLGLRHGDQPVDLSHVSSQAGQGRLPLARGLALVHSHEDHVRGRGDGSTGGIDDGQHQLGGAEGRGHVAYIIIGREIVSGKDGRAIRLNGIANRPGLHAAGNRDGEVDGLFVHDAVQRAGRHCGLQLAFAHGHANILFEGLVALGRLHGDGERAGDGGLPGEAAVPGLARRQDLAPAAHGPGDRLRAGHVKAEGDGLAHGRLGLARAQLAQRKGDLGRFRGGLFRRRSSGRLGGRGSGRLGGLLGGGLRGLLGGRLRGLLRGRLRGLLSGCLRGLLGRGLGGLLSGCLRGLLGGRLGGLLSGSLRGLLGGRLGGLLSRVLRRLRFRLGRKLRRGLDHNRLSRDSFVLLRGGGLFCEGKHGHH